MYTCYDICDLQEQAGTITTKEGTMSASTTTLVCKFWSFAIEK